MWRDLWLMMINDAILHSLHSLTSCNVDGFDVDALGALPCLATYLLPVDFLFRIIIRTVEL